MAGAIAQYAALFELDYLSTGDGQCETPCAWSSSQVEDRRNSTQHPLPAPFGP